MTIFWPGASPSNPRRRLVVTALLLILLGGSCAVHQTVLVTGAEGLVGSHVVDALLTRGDDVILIVDDNSTVANWFTERYGTERIRSYTGALVNETVLQQVLEAEQPDSICHLATTTERQEEDNRETPYAYIQDLVGTTQLLEVLRIQQKHKNATKISNIVLGSSSHVYGSMSTSNLNSEDDRVDWPLSSFAALQKANELYAYTWHSLYHLPVTALRVFDVYGPSLLRREYVLPPRLGNASRDCTYISDVVDGVLRALDRPMAYEIVNVGTGVSSPSTNVSGLLNQQGQALHSSDATDGHVVLPLTRANMTKAKELLGFVSHVSLEEGLERTLANNDPSTESSLVTVTQLNNSSVKTRRRRLLQRRRLARANNSSSLSSSWETLPVVEPLTGKKKVLVTGGAGFIGSHVADYLLNRGDDVVIIDEVNDYYDVNIKEGNLKLLTTKYGKDRVHIYRGDICDAELMEIIFETERPTFVCHMAARAGVRPSIEDPFVYIHSNVEGAARLMELSVKYNVQNFVFASSSSVYGGSKSTYFSEDQNVDRPISPYAASKKSCELLAYTYHYLYNLNVTGLRFFTVYGPRGRPDMAPFKFIDRVSRGKAMQQFGDGSSSRDYTYIDDIVDGVVRAVDRPYAYQIFNLGKGSGTKLSDFIGLVETCTGNKARIKHLPDQPGDVPYTCADVRKAGRLLGYKSSVPFEEGIQRTVAWYQEAYPENVKTIGSNTAKKGTQPTKDSSSETKTVPSKSSTRANDSGKNSSPSRASTIGSNTTLTTPEAQTINVSLGYVDKKDKVLKERTSPLPRKTLPPNTKSQQRIPLLPDWVMNYVYMQWVFVMLIILLKFSVRKGSRSELPATP